MTDELLHLLMTDPIYTPKSPSDGVGTPREQAALTAAKSAMDSAIAEVARSAAAAPEPPPGRVWVKKGEAHEAGDTKDATPRLRLLTGCSLIGKPCAIDYRWHRAAPAAPAESEWEEFTVSEVARAGLGVEFWEEGLEAWLPKMEGFPLHPESRYRRRRVSPAPAQPAGLAAVADCLTDSPMSPDLAALRQRAETPDLMGGRDLDQELAEARRQIGIKYLQLIGEFPQDKEDQKLGHDGGPITPPALAVKKEAANV